MQQQVSQKDSNNRITGETRYQCVTNGWDGLFAWFSNWTCLVAIWCKLWSKAGHFNKALSKGPKTTTWIFNLHADAHDFHFLNTSSASSIVFSSNLAHFSLVFFWLAGMELRYLFERSIGQDILNSDISQSHLIFSRYNYTISFEICIICCIDRYNYIYCSILFPYPHFFPNSTNWYVWYIKLL